MVMVSRTFERGESMWESECHRGQYHKISNIMIATIRKFHSHMRLPPSIIPLMEAPVTVLSFQEQIVKKTRELKVNVQFEPNRLGEEYLSSAYELVLPVKEKERKLRSKTTRNSESQVSQLQLEIFSSAASQ